MDLKIQQQIYYSNKELVPLKEIADSLLALEYIIKQSPKILEEIFPGTKISNVDVFINELKSDSIWEDLVVKFIFGDQKKLDVFITEARDKLGIEEMLDNPDIFSVIILALILSGGAYYLGKKLNAKDKATIQANNNVIIQIGAGLVDLSAENLQTIINNAVEEKDKDKLAKAAMQLVKPAKLDPEATITFNNNPELRMSNDSVRAMPSISTITEDNNIIEDFNSIELEIRATDLDSFKTGWAVVIPSIYAKRVKLQIDPAIDRDSLDNIRSLKADISVIFEYDKDLNKTPKLVFLRKIISSSKT
jgi:hypothetical protein